MSKGFFSRLLTYQRGAPLLACAALLGVTFVAYARFLDTGFAATDSLPLIETSRLHQLADIGLPFTRPVMADTRFVLGEVVYRPFVSLTFGLEYALWGLDARGYHLTNVALHLLGVLGVWWLLRQLGINSWSALAAAAVFALHPLVVASVPVIARRDSVLPVTAFVWGAGLLLSAERVCGWRRALRYAGSLALVAIALLSKESAFVALVMLPVLYVGLLASRGDPLRDVLWRSRVIVPCVGIGVGVLVVRTLALQGLGGFPRQADLLVMDLEKYSQVLGAYTRDLAWPFAGLAPSTRPIWPRLALAALVGVGLTCLWLPRRQAVVALAGGMWIVAFAIFCMALKINTIAWLTYFALVGVALVLGAVLHGALVRLASASAGRRAIFDRAVPAVLLGGLGVYAIGSLAASGLVRHYDQWQIAGDVHRRVTQALGECLAQAPQAKLVTVSGLPSSFEDGRVETNMLGVTLLEDYTVDAALRLLFPARNITAQIQSSETLRAPPSSMHFRCTERPPDTVELSVSY